MDYEIGSVFGNDKSPLNNKEGKSKKSMMDVIFFLKWVENYNNIKINRITFFFIIIYIIFNKHIINIFQLNISFSQYD